ncbi:hypothetical protein ALP43_200102 [Pseudomonas azotoformans]|nr:hypothetical protein ALP43_200102 [Pseudomonas azotoformans]
MSTTQGCNDASIRRDKMAIRKLKRRDYLNSKEFPCILIIIDRGDRGGADEEARPPEQAGVKLGLYMHGLRKVLDMPGAVFHFIEHLITYR